VVLGQELQAVIRPILVLKMSPFVFAGCFRRLFAGKKVAAHSIRRSMPVANGLECERACIAENQFACHGFNLRYVSSTL
jgi:hypothetical protein